MTIKSIGATLNFINTIDIKDNACYNAKRGTKC
jgi:hypothetical protein